MDKNGLSTYIEWFNWTQCENPEYNKYFVKLIEDVKANVSKYEEVYKLLSDEKSRNVFMDILTWKISLDSSKLVDANYESSNEQYFEPFKFLTKDEVFVDCGGFIGDSTMALLRHVGGGVKKVFLYDADSVNIEKAKENLKDIHDVVYRNVGVGKSHQFSFFAQNGLSSSAFTEDDQNGKKVEIVTIDEDIDEKVTFVKMDIEGFELQALQGAARHIKEDRPCLAICLYHKPEDMWELPLYISGLVDNYDYYIRHYTLYHGESVLYAVPKERKE